MKDYPYGRRGFAAMDPERRREISSLGGRAAQDRGVAHRWNRDEAVAAGIKGGRATRDRKQGAGK